MLSRLTRIGRRVFQQSEAPKPTGMISRAFSIGDEKLGGAAKDNDPWGTQTNDTLASALRLVKSRRKPEPTTGPEAGLPSASPLANANRPRVEAAGTVVRLTDDGPIVIAKGSDQQEKQDTQEEIPEEKTPVQITGFGGGTIGINNMFFHGSVTILPNMCFLWSPRTWSDVSVESLEFLRLLHPLPDLLLFGCGPVPKPISASLNRFLTEMRIPYELQSTPHACGTFNILNEEGRRVVACIVALTPEEHAIYQQRGANRFARKGLFNYQD